RLARQGGDRGDRPRSAGGGGEGRRRRLVHVDRDAPGLVPDLRLRAGLRHPALRRTRRGPAPHIRAVGREGRLDGVGGFDGVVRGVRRRSASIAVLLLTLGCGARGHRHEAPASDSAPQTSQPATSVSSAEAPQPPPPRLPPPHPTAPPPGTSDSPTNSIAPQLVEWAATWRAA